SGTLRNAKRERPLRPLPFSKSGSNWCALLRVVARAVLEEVVVRLDVFRQVHNLAARRRIARATERDPLLTGRHLVSRRDLVLDKDRLERALRHARAAVDARIGVDKVPWPLVLGLARHNAVHRANLNARAVAQAEAGNDMGHLMLL